MKFNPEYLDACIEQGARTGEAGFEDVLLMCCGLGGHVGL